MSRRHGARVDNDALSPLPRELQRSGRDAVARRDGIGYRVEKRSLGCRWVVRFVIRNAKRTACNVTEA